MIDFLGTPLIVDVLRTIRDGRPPRENPDLCRYGDAVDVAVDALAAAGAVCRHPGAQHPGEPTLVLTTKGRLVCSLVDEVVGFDFDEAC
ncbi:hypothetical protein ACFFX1_08380 [Dactylosporangium sucinum]|uniref:hypothetical protein n=1 Tax=Dactylosporangium sucinum TaxID=1424081 RepID=UPI00167E8979|nr:hypothetical protein [Dactylosporangium sucinum]